MFGILGLIESLQEEERLWLFLVFFSFRVIVFDVGIEILSISVEVSDFLGVFYGIQLLFVLLENEKVFITEIEDYFRFFYRGMYLDVFRNFYGKYQIMKLLDIMVKYKMNKFYFYLIDDEGWRLEILGLEEFIEVRI